MILNFLDPALERIWRRRTLPYLPGNPKAPLIHDKLTELYCVLGILNSSGLKGMKGREVEKSGSLYRVTIACGFVSFRLAGRDVADVGFDPPQTAVSSRASGDGRTRDSVANLPSQST